MTIDLTDRIVLVTGASRGIGKALAQALGAAGATVAVHYRTSREAAEDVAKVCGHGARAFGADLAEPSACDRLFDEVLAAYGRLDVLVNNAGVAFSIPMDAAQGEWQRAWDLTMAVNLRAVEWLCRRAVRHFRAQRGGRIVNIASRAAFRGDTPEYLAYAASKGGMVALTRSLARAFGKDGVTAFVVAPGFTRTDMAQEFIDAYGEDYAVRNLALGRMTEPEDVAPLVVLLASGLADHATGTTIDVNAGSYVH
ncbi:MAG: SDR family oxidoreductase [Rhodothermales bacterium]|nr:SDR family oxidoreductase [Rhodothermales bacterium]